jgi:hypothetical protein
MQYVRTGYFQLASRVVRTETTKRKCSQPQSYVIGSKISDVGPDTFSYKRSVKMVTAMLVFQQEGKMVVHETAVCRNLPIQNFIRERRKLDILNRRTVKHVVCLREYKEKQFICG